MKTAKMLTIPRLRSGWPACRAILVVALGLMVCLATVSEAGPMGTAWTYQGRLMDKNKPAEGFYGFQFRLFDSNDPCTGAQLGSPIDMNDLEVIDGHFTVELDFGSGIFDGNAVWLETSVVHSPLGSDPAALRPLQEVTPAPYALYAATAGAVAGGEPNYIPKFIKGAKLTNSVMYESGDNIGINTEYPEKLLHIVNQEGGYDGLGICLDPHGGGFTGGTTWNIDNSSGDFELTESRALPGYPQTRFAISNGNIGIGTTEPDEKLHVAGSIKIVDGTQAAGKVLTSDAEGAASWAPIPSCECAPSGVIVMWSGAIGSIPDGWALCDGGTYTAPNSGSVTTPDLTSKFIRSVPNASTDPGSTGGSSTHTHSGGSYTAASHTHTYSGTTSEHTADDCCAGSVDAWIHYTKIHSHTYSGTTGSGGGGAISGTSAEASSLPPYYELAFIMKL